MSKRIIYLLLAVSLGLNVGVIATTLLHRPPGPPSGPGPDRDPRQSPDPARMVEQHLRGMTRHLDLDEEQQGAIRAVMENHAPLLLEFQSAAKVAGSRLSEAFAAPEFDPDLFRLLISEAAVARSRVDSLSAEMLVAEAAVLTPDQRRKFARVAPSIHSNPQPRPRAGGPPPREGGRPRREGEPPPR